MMRKLLLAGMMLASNCGLGRADVVTTVSGAGPGNTNDPNTTQYIRLTPGQPSGLPLLRFDNLVINKNSNGNAGSLNLTLWGRDSGGVTTSLGTMVFTTDNRSGDRTVDLSGLSGGNVFSNSNYSWFVLQLSNINNRYSSANGNSNALTLQNNPISAPVGALTGAAFVTNNTGTTLENSGTFLYVKSLQATAVPEPGTLALGAFAAMSGFGGWWMRRKKRQNANLESESLDLPGAACSASGLFGDPKQSNEPRR